MAFEITRFAQLDVGLGAPLIGPWYVYNTDDPMDQIFIPGNVNSGYFDSLFRRLNDGDVILVVAISPVDPTVKITKAFTIFKATNQVFITAIFSSPFKKILRTQTVGGSATEQFDVQGIWDASPLGDAVIAQQNAPGPNNVTIKYAAIVAVNKVDIEFTADPGANTPLVIMVSALYSGH